MTKLLKSPLRYPGGKSRAVKVITQYFPSSLKTLCAPFFGGGSIELYFAQQGIRVYGYDVSQELVCFWEELLTNKPRLVKMVSDIKKSMDKNPTKETFKRLQKDLANSLEVKEIAALYFAINRSSFSGTTLSGGYSTGHPRFNQNSIERLARFPELNNLTVERNSFECSISKHKHDFLYCDPPYYINNFLYGNSGNLHKGFDHFGLHKILSQRDGWILSYNNTPEILELYKDYKILFPNWKYGMSTDKLSKEVLILNF